MSFPAARPTPEDTGRTLTCRLCGFMHAAAPLQPGQRATCVRCGTLLEKRGRFGPHAPLAFTLTGLILALPAATLPLVTVAKMGNVRVTRLYSGAAALWGDGMRTLATWVFICGTLAPILLFAVMALLIGNRTDPAAAGRLKLLPTIHALEHWAMPEVHVLAVLVALIKLGSLVNVFLGPGFWCYAAMSLALALAWRSFEFESSRPAADARRAFVPP